MRMMTSCELIAFSPDAHEVGTPAAETRRKVKAQELSLTQADIYQAGGEGLEEDQRPGPGERSGREDGQSESAAQSGR